MIIDQATELRQLVRKDRQPSATWAAPSARLLLIVGSRPGTGATTAAVHLALALQAAGQQTLLVDADPHRAAATAICRLEPRLTLRDVLCGGRGCRETILPGPEGIHVLPGFDGAPHVWTEPAQLRLLAELRSPDLCFDQVVIDRGAFAPADVRRFWQTADAVLIVTRPETSAMVDAYAAIKQMAPTRARPPLWTLVTQADSADVARDVHLRLSRACQKFLDTALAEGGWLPRLALPLDGNTARTQLAPLAAELRVRRHLDLACRNASPAGCRVG